MNFQEYLYNHGFQREDLLARLAESLELDESRSKRMESAYNAIYDVLKADPIFFSKVDFVVYPQGSKAIGTTTKPIGQDEFDLDIVVQIRESYHIYTSSEIYNHLIRVFKNNQLYKPKLIEKNRCARINYEGDFHLDILPGCIIIETEDKLMVPDRELASWTSSFPKGYSKWFLDRAENVRETLLKKAFSGYIALSEAKAEQEDLPNEDYYDKEPLKRSVQLTKRYRDIFFANKPKYRTSSIVLTTIFGQFYDGEASIYETIDNVLNKILRRYSAYEMLYESSGVYNRIKVLNPVNEDEDFTEKWDKDNEYYIQFITFARSFKENWERLKNGDFGVAEDLFGSTRTKTILKAQLESLASTKSNTLEKAGLIILSGNNYVDGGGNITETHGYKSKPNRNYGSVEIDIRPRQHTIFSKNYIAPYIQKEYVDKNFPWLQTVVKDGKLLGKGKIKPKGCKKEYEILVSYDINDTGRKERVFILNDSKIKFGTTPHLYPGNSLCLYYPKDLPQHLELNFVDIIPWISEWLVMYELWKKYGIWLANEIKH
ncbi:MULTISPECIES: nucleotidyltransferase [Aequorivita]|uniref:Nucleotidyltransferase n=1 Tax=Aequorivita iocasae TaxID=2803865 RepID=A0ABX7DSM7_9FLAO|nr:MULTISPECIES: nucleotidyltransferase [Aequorivita]QQX76487.1 nucleotidyltransferase [Aequorivita iocasae]UCA55959.1 nucleotidyltransferase [Aequorivita sp. F7]